MALKAKLRVAQRTSAHLAQHASILAGLGASTAAEPGGSDAAAGGEVTGAPADACAQHDTDTDGPRAAPAARRRLFGRGVPLSAKVLKAKRYQ